MRRFNDTHQNVMQLCRKSRTILSLFVLQRQYNWKLSAVNVGLRLSQLTLWTVAVNCRPVLYRLLQTRTCVHSVKRKATVWCLSVCMFVPLQHRSSVSAPRQQCGQHTFQPRCPIISTMIINHNNDNNVYGVIIMTEVIAMNSPDSFDECSLD